MYRAEIRNACSTKPKFYTISDVPNLRTSYGDQIYQTKERRFGEISERPRCLLVLVIQMGPNQKYRGW